MTILTFPTLTRAPQQAEWWLQRRTQGFASPLTGSQQTLELPGSFWRASLSWPPLMEADWRALAGFLTSLRGRAGRFYYGPPHARVPRIMPAYTTPLVMGGGQSGTSLNADGFSASQTIFHAGDFVSYDTPSGRRMLHMVTADCASSGGGAVAIPIEPAIREAPADNTPLRFGQPGAPLGCVMMLTEDSAARVSVGLARIGSMALDIEEALI